MRRNKRLPKLPASPAPDWSDYRSCARPELYSTEFVQELARTFKIDPARVQELNNALEEWADVFRFHKAGSDEWPRSSKIKTELELIKSRINALNSTLENLHPETKDRFWQPEAGIERLPVSVEPISRSTSAYIARGALLGWWKAMTTRQS